MHDHYTKWPDENERKTWGKMKKFFNFPNAVEVMEGTLIETGNAPNCCDPSDYNGRNLQRSIACLVMNDLKRQVCAYSGRFPGSAHDNRFCRSMTSYQKADEYFYPIKYVKCVTAFDPSPFSILAFSANVGFVQLANKQLFNHTLSKPCVSSENTIGMRNGWCPGALRKLKIPSDQ